MANDTLRVTSGNVQDQNEAWWWDQEVHARAKAKKGLFRELMCC